MQIHARFLNKVHEMIIILTYSIQNLEDGRFGASTELSKHFSVPTEGDKGETDYQKVGTSTPLRPKEIKGVFQVTWFENVGKLGRIIILF